MNLRYGFPEVCFAQISHDVLTAIWQGSFNGTHWRVTVTNFMLKCLGESWGVLFGALFALVMIYYILIIICLFIYLSNFFLYIYMAVYIFIYIYI